MTFLSKEREGARQARERGEEGARRAMEGARNGQGRCVEGAWKVRGRMNAVMMLASLNTSWIFWKLSEGEGAS